MCGSVVGLKWFDRGYPGSMNPWGWVITQGVPRALWSPEMKEPALSGVPVKYALVTPLGDEDLVD